MEAQTWKEDDRPVYRFPYPDDRKVKGYDILNVTAENGLGIRLEDIVDGKYTLNKGNSPTLSKSK